MPLVLANVHLFFWLRLVDFFARRLQWSILVFSNALETRVGAVVYGGGGEGYAQLKKWS